MMRAAVIVLEVLVVLMLAGAVPLGGDAHLAVFRSPIFLAAAAGLGALSLAACVRYARSWRRLLFFWPAHVGVTVILVGAGLGYLYAESGRLVLPVAAWHTAAQLSRGDDEPAIPLGFKLSVQDLEVNHYPPTYLVYEPRIMQPREADDYRLEADRTVTADGDLVLPDGRRVERKVLRDEANASWRRQIRLPGATILDKAPQIPRSYEATLGIENDGKRTVRALRVNAPVTVDGWRIFLESYGADPRRYVQLGLRRDPGRPVVIGGIWLVMIGTALLCWRPSKIGLKR